MDYIKQREFREYDDIISIRLNNQYYNLLKKINPKNVSKVVRLLIRVDICDGLIEISDKDIKKCLLYLTNQKYIKLTTTLFEPKKTKL